MINKNKLFRQVHIYLSLFFLPCALLFALDEAFKQPISYRQFNFIKCLNIYLIEGTNLSSKNTEIEEQQIELEHYKG